MIENNAKRRQITLFALAFYRDAFTYTHFSFFFFLFSLVLFFLCVILILYFSCFNTLLTAALRIKNEITNPSQDTVQEQQLNYKMVHQSRDEFIALQKNNRRLQSKEVEVQVKEVTPRSSQSASIGSNQTSRSPSPITIPRGTFPKILIVDDNEFCRKFAVSVSFLLQTL